MTSHRAPALAALAALGVLALAGCGTTTAAPAAPAAAPAAAVTVTAAPPQVVINNNAPAPVQPAAPPVYVPVYAGPALTDCGAGSQGEEVYANADTSCPFALNVEQDYASGGYWYQAGTSQFWSYSPVTGQSYLMTSSSAGDPVVVTGGDNALVQFQF